MRKSRQEAAETRERIVEVASAEFRRNGVDATGLANLMAVAGLTHGGFYKHFDSKEQLVAESLELAAGSMVDAIGHAVSASPNKDGFQAAVDEYLSAGHRDGAADGCPFVALGSEVARGGEAVREAATHGFMSMVEMLASQLSDMTPAAAKKEALWTLSAMIGAVTMSRVVNNPELSTLILRQARKHLTRPE